MSKTENNNLSAKIQINWLITINLNPFEKYCKIREKSK